MIKNITINKIYIIESLYDSDKKYGTELYNDFFRWNETINSQLITVHTVEDFIECFETIKKEIKENKAYPFIHFEIHGNENGLGLSSNEFIKWEKVIDLLREINVLTKNNLIISLAVCYGAYLHAELDVLNKAPYVGIFAPLTDINQGYISESFSKFFEILLSTRDFNKAINTAALFSKDKKECIYLNAEDLFERIYEWRNSFYDDPKAMDLKISELVKESLEKKKPQGAFYNSALRKYAEKILNEDKISMKKRLKDNFLMLD